MIGGDYMEFGAEMALVAAVSSVAIWWLLDNSSTAVRTFWVATPWVFMVVVHVVANWAVSLVS